MQASFRTSTILILVCSLAAPALAASPAVEGRTSIATPEGRLFLESRSDPGGARVDLALAGSPEHASFLLESDPAGELEPRVRLEFSGVGTLTYTVAAHGFRIVATDVEDCVDVWDHPVYRASSSALTIVRQRISRPSHAGHPDDGDALAWFVLSAIELGPGLIENCLLLNAGETDPCVAGKEWEEDCTNCCEIEKAVLRFLAPGLCGVATGLICAPSGPGAAACGAIGAGVCSGIVHYRYQQCIANCAPLPSKPVEGQTCGQGGTCRDACGLGETSMPGTCAAGNVCCGPLQL